MLQVANISQFRKKLKSYIDSVADKNDAVIVNGNGKSVVVISLDEFNAMDETQYLLSSKANKAMMYKALAEIEKGKTTKISLKSLKALTNND